MRIELKTDGGTWHEPPLDSWLEVKLLFQCIDIQKLNITCPNGRKIKFRKVKDNE